MQFQPDSLDHPFFIKSYVADKKTITILKNNSNEIINLSKSAIVLFDQVIENWEPKSYKELTQNNLKLILSYDPEIIIISTGDKLITLDYEVLEPFYKSKIPFEVMTTINACRTYNLLANEHRRVAVGLII